ncbi:MAG: 50S rRNA methyltransferase [Anaerolineae bacterium]|jgi:23S rRNA (cytidine2498-2'-O)-methyltransferase|nr:50S rRNA methyltransferase [Anaerolineae bacterium]
MADAVDREVLFTADPDSRALALSEVLAAAPGASIRHWLATDVGWVTLVHGWSDLVASFYERPPIFCRHMYPAQVRVPLMQDSADLEALADASASLAQRLIPERPFSVQTRLLGRGWPFGPYLVNTRLAEMCVGLGATLDVRNPVDVLSVVLTPDEGFLGVSCAADNLSDWAGGARRFRREPDQISRAEFKLLEAMEIFHLDAPHEGLVLDLGAAPGGWTRVMRSGGASVVAVDPADLAPVLARDPQVRHVRSLAQVYLPDARQRFDVILNDMRMDARDSARVMSLAADRLGPAGWALVTLKLPKGGVTQVLSAALTLLRRRYTLIGVRQLFHNRSEVTAALRPKPPGAG